MTSNNSTIVVPAIMQIEAFRHLRACTKQVLDAAPPSALCFGCPGTCDGGTTHHSLCRDNGEPMRYCCYQAAFHCEVSGIRSPRVACRREPIAMGRQTSGLRTYMEPMIRSLSADLAAALTHARLPTVTDTARDNQTLAQASRIQELYETFLAEMGLQARRLSALAQECADASHACDKDDTELQTVRSGSEQLQHLNHVHANLQTLAPEVISTLYLHRDCLPEFFGQNSPLVYFAERYASLTEVGGATDYFPCKGNHTDPEIGADGDGHLCFQGVGCRYFRGSGSSRVCRISQATRWHSPQPPWCPPRSAPYDPNTETRAAAVSYLAIGCIALGSNTSATWRRHRPTERGARATDHAHRRDRRESRSGEFRSGKSDGSRRRRRSDHTRDGPSTAGRRRHAADTVCYVGVLCPQPGKPIYPRGLPESRVERFNYSRHHRPRQPSP